MLELWVKADTEAEAAALPVAPLIAPTVAEATTAEATVAEATVAVVVAATVAIAAFTIVSKRAVFYFSSSYQ